MIFLNFPFINNDCFPMAQLVSQHVHRLGCQPFKSKALDKVLQQMSFVCI